MTAKKHPGGRPPKYTSKDQIIGLIDAYFKECEGEPMLDDNGKPMLNKYGHPIMIGRKPPTVTGLALALGFSTRTALLSYQGKKEFADTITRAKTKVEEYAERRLFDKDGCNGAQFSLRNNFSGWYDKPQTDLDREEQQLRIQAAKEKLGQGEKDTSLFENIVKAAGGKFETGNDK